MASLTPGSRLLRRAARFAKPAGRRVFPHFLRAWVRRLLGGAAGSGSVPAPPDPGPAVPAPPGPDPQAGPAELVYGPELVAEWADLLTDAYLPPGPGYDVIVLPVIDWSFRVQRPQHLARQFARHGHRVFYVRTTFGPPEDLDRGRLALRPQEPNLVEFELPARPGLNLYQHEADADAVELWVRAMERLAARHGLAEAVCLVQLPFWEPLARRLRERFGWRVVYDCMDRHSGFSTNRPEMLASEDRLSRCSDLVITTARVLHEEQGRLNPSCELIPNACEFHHFRPAADPGPVPPAVAGLPGPVVGYYGAISDWFATDLVAGMARRRPGWSFVLIGNTFGADLEPFRGLANVHLLGEQPYGTLPGYLRAFDVALIPFHINPLTEATNPVKYFEYLSAGKPVVSVPLPELQPYADAGGGLVYLGETADELVAAAEAALADRDPRVVARRQQVASENTWERRYAALDTACQRLYPKATAIIITYNNLNLNKVCIESLFRYTAWPNFELVVVDNGSTDGTRDYLADVRQTRPNVKLVLNDTNRGFAGGNNQGIRAADGEYVALLNNDTIVTRGWLGRLIRFLERGPRVGMVGPVTNSIGNEAKIPTDYRTVPGLEAFAARLAAERAGEAFDIPMLALFCAVMRRGLFDEVGLLDERFEVGMFEDDDLAEKVRRAGYRVVCAEDTLVHHFQSQSFKLLGSAEYDRLLRANRERFERKWGKPWEPHRGRDYPPPPRAA